MHCFRDLYNYNLNYVVTAVRNKRRYLLGGSATSFIEVSCQVLTARSLLKVWCFLPAKKLWQNDGLFHI